MLHKKAVLKSFAIFTGKHLCWNLFFNKNADLHGPSFMKKRLVFFVNINKFVKTPILKKICQWLILRVSLELFSVRTNNIGSEKEVFSEIKLNKNRSETQLYEKNLSFYDVLDHFVFLFFSTARQAAFTLRNKRWY